MQVWTLTKEGCFDSSVVERERRGGEERKGKERGLSSFRDGGRELSLVSASSEKTHA